jgi:hypothetical protein
VVSTSTSGGEMNRQDLVDQVAEAQKAVKAAEDYRDALVSQLGPNIKPGDVLEGKTHRIRVRDRAVLVAERLQERVSKALWLRITVRKPVADLYRAEIKRGRLSQEDIDASSKRSRMWVEVL